MRKPKKMNRKKVDSIIQKEILEQSGTLDFVDCGLKMIPEEIFEMIWLTRLRISHNPPHHDRDNKVESMNAYSKYEKSKKLNNLKITQLPMGLAKLSNLEVLEISPRLTGSKGRWPLNDVEVLKDLKKLKHLDLRSNAIINIGCLKNLTKLEYLALRGNQISDITDLKYLKNLKYLDLSFNSRIEKGYKSLNNLIMMTELDITYTRPGSLGCIKKCCKLEKLSVAHTAISDFSVIKKLPQLRSLDANHLKDADFTTLKSSKNLKNLNLSYNKIENINFLKQMKEMETLDLRYNSLDDISAISGMIKMKKLWINDNRISDISALTHMKEMDDLSMFHNKIKDISVLHHLKKIQDLLIKDNPIRDYSPLRSLKNLKYLDGSKAADEIYSEECSVKSGNTYKEIEKALEYILTGNNEKLRGLLEKGLDPRSETEDRTPLRMFAKDNENQDAYLILKEYQSLYKVPEADPSRVNSKGKQASDFAKASKN
jgi:Leucine-rich repeat (LRR) protein